MDTDAPLDLDPRYHTVDKKGNLRPDFLFSYWIYAWFFIFYFTPDHSPKGTPSALIKQYMNPTFTLYAAFLENLATLVLMMVYQTQWVVLLKFVAMMAVVKLLPLYLLRNYPIRWSVYSKTIEMVRTNQPYTPFFGIIERISGVIQSIFAPVSA